MNARTPLPPITIRRPAAPLRATVELPRSKSVSNRALMMAAFAGAPGTTAAQRLATITHLSDAEDTRILHGFLRDRPAELFCGAGGTTFRFALAWACIQVGEERILTGDARLLERPHADLVQALRSLGADITSIPGRDAPPYRVRGRALAGGRVVLDEPMSSQYITALLLIAPLMRTGLELHWTGHRLSEPYVRMTLKTLQHYGVDVRLKDNVIYVRPTALAPAPLDVPGDWSAAAFWYQIAALAPDARITLTDLHRDGWQGDEAAVHHWSAFVDTEVTQHGIAINSATGTRTTGRGVAEVDLVNTPDLFQALCITHAVRGIPTRFTGLHTLPLKENDRLAEMAHLLTALGVAVEATADSFTLNGPLTRTEAITVDPKQDHRLAMAAAPLALVCDAVTVLHPEVVAKSYPAYWEQLKAAGFGVE